MKNLRTVALCVSISLSSICSFAQKTDIPINEPNLNKPQLFQNLPDKIPVNMDNINSWFMGEVGRPISLKLTEANNLQFEGNVVSTVSKYENSIQSTIVNSINYPGARLVITKITDKDGAISYTGRILSLQHGDLFELKNENNQYFLIKRKFYDLVNE